MIPGIHIFDSFYLGGTPFQKQYSHFLMYEGVYHVHKKINAELKLAF